MLIDWLQFIATVGGIVIASRLSYLLWRSQDRLTNIEETLANIALRRETEDRIKERHLRMQTCEIVIADLMETKTQILGGSGDFELLDSERISQLGNPGLIIATTWCYRFIREAQKGLLQENQDMERMVLTQFDCQVASNHIDELLPELEAYRLSFT